MPLCILVLIYYFFSPLHNNHMKPFFGFSLTGRYTDCLEKVCASAPHGLCHKYVLGRSREVCCPCERKEAAVAFKFYLFYFTCLMGAGWRKKVPKAVWESLWTAFTGLPSFPRGSCVGGAQLCGACVATVSCRQRIIGT